ncbi:MAG: 30S ribosome-binding factor RbfA [Firmicutes bacterium]|nr:30S ribosome-binding factor RbfA [Bacillota bacterium]
MSNTRKVRIEDQIRTEIGDMLLKDLKDPRIGFASVTRVQLSGDKREVKVYISVFGTDEEKQQTMQALNHARGFIRTEIGKRIKLRHTPQIHFILDESIEQGSKVMAILSELAKNSEEPKGE